jgi:hypothetical protein
MSRKGQDMADEDKRIAARARALWEQAGRPASGPEDYVGRARELIAIEEHEQDTLKPTGAEPQENVEDDPIASPDVFGPEGEPVEPVLAVENEGEFPTLTDEGEGEQVPRRRPGRG